MNKTVKLALIVVLLGAAAFFVFRFLTAPKEGPAPDDRQSVWKCSDEACKNVFRVTQKERLAVQRETGSSVPKCPKCSKLSTEVYECQFCKEAFEPVGHSSYPDNCPHCGKNLAGDASKDLAKPKKEKPLPGHN